MNALLQWLDDRTGLVSCWRQHQQAPCSERPCWLGLWSGAILFTFVMQAVTGFFLWAFYSTSAQSAWESIYYVQYEVMGGWLVRGIHYYAGQVLLGLIGLYVLSMIFTGAYRAPRELVFWLAVGMGAITIALLLTGDLLTWSQRGYWSTDVRTKFLFLLPGIGGELYKLAVGGPGMGHLTITRFLALHAGLFTAVFGAMLWLHARWTRQAAEAEAAAGQPALPPRANQALMSAAACAGVMAIVLVATVWGAVGGAEGQLPADYLGAELGAPRDPGDAYAAARPDWYFVGVY
jgi:quinol-cytochrome oxidoreductase complex cytochrome b subunit